ncbi:MAG: hypothetical protein Q8P89_04775 [bacterium]|nr:hypothetical protein [bacterium]
MSAAVEKKSPGLKRLEPEQDLSEDPTPLLPGTIRKCAGALYSRINKMIHPPSDKLQKILPIETKRRDYRDDPKVRESFVLRLENEGTTEVYRFLFGNDKRVAVHRRVESDSLPIDSQPWERIMVALSVKENDSVIIYQSEGAYSDRENESTAVARAEMLVERLDGLWSSKKQRISAVKQQVERKMPLLDKFKITPEDLFKEIRDFTDSSKSPQTAKFKKEYPGSDIIILDLTAGPNGEYTDAYIIELGCETGVAIMHRRRNLSLQPIEDHSWEQLLILTDGGGINGLSATHRSRGIKEYGDVNEAVEVKGTLALARGELLIRRFKDDFSKISPGG